MRVIKKQKESGFTLIELLLVIAIIAILALLIFVALDPGKRFRESREQTRETKNIKSFIKTDLIKQDFIILKPWNYGRDTRDDWKYSRKRL